MARRSSRSRSRDKEEKTETRNKGMLNLVDAVESPAPERKAAARALDQQIAYEENNQPPRARRRLIGGVEVPTPERMATAHALDRRIAYEENDERRYPEPDTLLELLLEERAANFGAPTRVRSSGLSFVSAVEDEGMPVRRWRRTAAPAAAENVGPKRGEEKEKGGDTTDQGGGKSQSMFQVAVYGTGKVGCGYGKLDEIVGYGKGYLKGSRWLFEGAKNDQGDPLEALEAAGAIASFTRHLRDTALEMQGYFQGHIGAQTVYR